MSIDWFVSELGTEFGSEIDDLIIAYMRTKWTESTPALAPVVPTDIEKQNMVVIGESDLPPNVTYYIQVQEGDTIIKSNDIRKDLYTFNQDITIDCHARRLQPRENFPHLNNMINHVMKIFGVYKSNPPDIPGIQSVKLKFLSGFHTPRLTTVTNLYHRTVTLELEYYRQDATGA